MREWDPLEPASILPHNADVHRLMLADALNDPGLTARCQLHTVADLEWNADLYHDGLAVMRPATRPPLTRSGLCLEC